MYFAHVAEIDGRLEEGLLEGLEAVHWKDHVKKDSVVFVKPNFTFPRYREGITTNAWLLKCVLELIRSRSGDVTLGESDGGYNSFKAEAAFEGHHMYEICKGAGVELLNLSKLPSRFIDGQVQSKKVKVQLPTMLLDKVDCFISVPVLKVHVMTGVSLGLKNLWGCYPDTMRCLCHANLDRKLTLMAKTLKPKITVIDGLFGLNNHGPMFGDPVKMGIALMSDNVVVSDALGASIMGVPLEKAKHITIAEREGIGTTNLDDVDVNAGWTRYKRQFQLRKTMIDRASGHTVPQPHCRQDRDGFTADFAHL